MTGLAGAVVFGLIMDKTHRYRAALRIGFGSAFVILWLLYHSLDVHAYIPAMICFGLLGFFMLPMVAITMEAAVEYVFIFASDFCYT